MTIKFTAQVVGVEELPDEETLLAGVAEHEDGSGLSLTFMCGLYEPDEQDTALGMDSYCLVTPDQGTAYGGVSEATLQDGVLRVVVAEHDLEALKLDETDIEAGLAVDNESVEQLRRGLRRILAYGRLDARPAIIRL
ncbi:Imm10 family immunity protein [Actinomadura sp. WMMB 499]|uniref:Imm10 family immunity protein n=1 Tax=Actinomadura sp. WMMB 499 TaxID=1219491 RepID=UPI001244BA35|nr:Imm10 family immunity protein [Actinomadura sp. WMMB 499]QFG21109.1 hypothetical protein F7P10_08120 [Actinomadura sp. WMMB 499]